MIILNHLKAMALKFIATLIILYVILGLWYDMSFGNVFLITLALGIISYILGDMLILSRTNNTVATLTDFALAFLLIWIMGENLTHGDSLILPALVSAVAIALFESYFHKYVANNVFEDNTGKNQNQTSGKLSYQTEASEEITPGRTDINNKLVNTNNNNTNNTEDDL